MLLLIGGYELFFVSVFAQRKDFEKETSPTGRCSYSDDEKRIPKDKLVIQKYLDMMQTVLLELDTGEDVHVSHVPVQFFQLKFDVRFGHQLDFLDAEDSRSLAKFAKAAAPPRPEAEF
jgi:hypothetical protein